MEDHNKSCAWTYRFEIVGVVLIVLATLLTILTLSSLGIAAMFIVGMILCGHGCMCRHDHLHCHTDENVDHMPAVKRSRRAVK